MQDEQPPKQKPKKDSHESQVDSLKKQLEMAKKACFLGLYLLDKDWNPDGNNDSHKFEDLKKEFVKSC